MQHPQPKPKKRFLNQKTKKSGSPTHLHVSWGTWTTWLWLTSQHYLLRHLDICRPLRCNLVSHTNTKSKYKYFSYRRTALPLAVSRSLSPSFRSTSFCFRLNWVFVLTKVFMILGLETWFTQEFTKSLTLPTSSNTYSIFNNGIKTKMFNRSFFSLSGWLSPSVWPIPSGKSVRLFENGNQCLRGYLTKTILKMWDCSEFRYLCNNVFHVETLWNFPFQLYCVSLRPVAIS